MLVMQIAVACGLALMGLIGTHEGPHWLGIIAVGVAFMSASLDIVFDAYRTDLLLPIERGFGAAVWVNGYRLALLVASAGAMVMADRIGWNGTYLVLAGLMGAGVVSILLSPNPPASGRAPKTLGEAVGAPLRELFGRPGIYGLLSLIVFYKLGDAVAGSLQTAFFIGGLGFSSAEVGYVKGLGVAATLIGALAGGVLMAKTGLMRSLLLFGLLQALSNLSFMFLAWIGKSFGALAASVVIENVTGGMGTAAFVALVMSLCDHRYTATQFALLSSLEALGRVFSGRPSAEAVSLLGWGWFFLLSFLLALPGCWLVWQYRQQLAPQSADNSASRAPLMKPA
jgi:PAT family beta-lactamase induction signal transducer AmpG